MRSYEGNRAGGSNPSRPGSRLRVTDRLDADGHESRLNQYDFTGRVAFVTGGASGIGAATAERLRAGGAKVATFDWNSVADIAGDVSRSADVGAAVAKLKSLAPAGGQRPATPEKERDVHPEPGRQIAQALAAPADAPEAIERPESRGRITRTSAHSGRHRDVLLQPDSGSAAHLCSLLKEPRGPQDQVGVVSGKRGIAGREGKRLVLFQDQAVEQVHRLEHRREFVVAIRPLPEDLEHEIDFGRGPKRERPGPPRPSRQGTKPYHAPSVAVNGTAGFSRARGR